MADRYQLSSKGQALVVVVFIMTLALAIGITASTRLLKSVDIGVKQDASGRALSVAEAAVERMLRLDTQTLSNYITYGNCGSNCQLTITGEDGVLAQANVTLSFIGNSQNPLAIDLKTGDVFEVDLTGYQNGKALQVCWNNPSGDRPSIYAMLVYGSSPTFAIDSYAYNSIGSVYTSNGFSNPSASGGYDNCFTIPGHTNPKLARLRAFYNAVTAYILPSGGAAIPGQGIMIESMGSVSGVTKIVRVVKSKPFLPLQFDFAVFSKSATSPLSN